MTPGAAYHLLTGEPMPVSVGELTAIAAEVPELEAALALNHMAAVGENPTQFELLVTLIGADEARHLVHVNAARLVNMAQRQLMDLGLSREAAQRVIAAFDLARAAAREEPIGEGRKIRGPEDVDLLMRDRIATSPHEEIWALYMSSTTILVGLERLAIGGVDVSPLDTREMVRRAFELNARSIIMVHNHPSANPHPSGADFNIARELIKQCRVVGLTFADSVVIGRPGFSSLAKTTPRLWAADA